MINCSTELKSKLMELIQGCQSEGFLYATTQARKNLLRVSLRLEKLPNTDRDVVLHQYDVLNRYYGGFAFRETNELMKEKGSKPEEFDVAQVINNNLLARACELRLGLGITYGWIHYALIDKPRREYYQNELIRQLPIFKSKEEYISLLANPISNLLDRVEIGPAMIEVPSEMHEYGIALGLKENHQQILKTFRTIDSYWNRK